MQLQEARPAPKQGKDHHLPRSNRDGSDPARSWAPLAPADPSGSRAGRRGAKEARPLRGGPMSAAPEETLEAGVRLPPQSRTSPRKQGAPGRAAAEAGSGRSQGEAAELGGGKTERKKKKRDRGGGCGEGEVAARQRGAGHSAVGEGVGCAEEGAGYSRSR